MGLFKRKAQAEKVMEDRELVSSNEKAIEALIVLAKDDEAMKKNLLLLQEKLKYLVPSEKGEEYDKKIKNLIEDLRIVLVKADGQEPPKKAETLLTQIKVLIGDRTANV